MSPTFTVAHVNVSKGYRGGERQTELLIGELAGHNVRQVLIARRGAPLTERLRDTDIEIREVSGNPVGTAVAARGVDLIHVHEGRSVYGAYFRSLWSSTPYIVTRRVNNPIGDHFLAHRAYRGASFVAAVAPQVADIVRAFDPGIRVCVIHSGSSAFKVNPETSAAIRASLPGSFIVGHVGALDNDQKGQEFIIRAACELSMIYPEIHFVLVGGGDDEEMLKAQATSLSNVSFAGFVENVGDYLAAFDVFILPSNREGIGSILFDAMEQRLPIVASRVGGVPDIVHENENGFLIDPGRPDQIVAAIKRLHDDPELCQRLGNKGHEIVRDFTAGVMCEKYLELYHRCLGQDERRSAA